MMKVERTKTVTVSREVLRVVRAIFVDGALAAPGRFIEVDAIAVGGMLEHGSAARTTAEEVGDAYVIQAEPSHLKPLS